MHNRPRFQLILALALAVAIAALATTLALGRAAEPIPSNVLLFAQEKAKPFRGRVTARRLACRVHRKVKVFHAQRSNHRLVDKTRTNHRGQWSIPTPNAQGDFFAKVMRERKRGRAGTPTYICRRDYSPTRHFGN
jgi:hypothetical protein